MEKTPALILKISIMFPVSIITNTGQLIQMSRPTKLQCTMNIIHQYRSTLTAGWKAITADSTEWSGSLIPKPPNLAGRANKCTLCSETGRLNTRTFIQSKKMLTKAWISSHSTILFIKWYAQNHAGEYYDNQTLEHNHTISSTWSTQPTAPWIRQVMFSIWSAVISQSQKMVGGDHKT